MASKTRFSWGIYLQDERDWAELSPRLCKGSAYSCDLVPALLDELRGLTDAGHDPVLKRIPSDTLKAMKGSR